jgi:predicted RNA-binding protein YlqC (UPF0109 family)
VEALLMTLVRALVEAPERVFVQEHVEGAVSVLELEVAPDDRGRVIGRRGRTADALRTVLDAVGRRRGRRCELEIRD